ncbi:hypothetical protein [Halomonas sp. S2151]|uniref:hypothetical protein n=1 Tax=Halomonas sp. S2151 TaxID=579478 RepID=UPI0012EE455C|nr:hypothetical protein [Halomonas sp. S2151]
MIYVVTFVDPRGFDGAAKRIKTLLKIYEDGNIDEVAVIELMPFIGTFSKVRVWSYKNGYPFVSKEFEVCMSKFRQFSRFFAFPFSISACRYPDLELFSEASESDTLFVCHTSRVYCRLPRRYKRKVIHVDLCDDLVSTYLRAFVKHLFEIRLKLATIFFVECVSEMLSVINFARNDILLSFITERDKTSMKKRINKAPVFSFPNGTDSSLLMSRKEKTNGSIVFGVVGNFRTVANRSVITNILNSDFFDIEKDKIFLAGIFSNELVEEYCNICCIESYGEFGSVEELEGKFDIGVCLVNVQGGFQTKLIDYLALGVNIIANDNVRAPFEDIVKFQDVVDEIFLEENVTREDVRKANSSPNMEAWSKALHQISSYQGERDNFIREVKNRTSNKVS